MNKEQLIRKFEEPEQLRKLRHNYAGLIARIREDGFFPESLTGTYPGMFPRTVGALARLLISTGRCDLLEKNIMFCMDAMRKYDLEHVPHVIDKNENAGPVILDPLRQIDGQAHLILAWALLCLARGRSGFEDDSYDFFARLMNRSVSDVLLERPMEWRCEPGVILNTHLEHSREWNMWCAYDILSNSFVVAALENMIDVARRRGDATAAENWHRVSHELADNIHANMTFEHEGKRCYCEMLLPTGRKPEIFPGFSWLNLAPVPAGCRALSDTVLENTIEIWHEKAAIHWDGPTITACELNFEASGQYHDWNGPAELGCEWSPEGHNNQTYGKMLGWDLRYCVGAGCYRQAYDILCFLEQVNTGELYSEIFTYKPSRGKWIMRDAGNGEQCAWLCWALIESRILLGLEPL